MTKKKDKEARARGYQKQRETSETARRGSSDRGTVRDVQNYKTCPECGNRIAIELPYDVHPVCAQKKKKGLGKK